MISDVSNKQKNRRLKTDCRLETDYVGRLIKFIYEFLDDQIYSYRQFGFLLGLSGGIDSAMLLKLVVNRYGPKSIHCIITENKGYSKKADIDDAEFLCKELGVSYDRIDLTDVEKEFRKLPYIGGIRTDYTTNFIRQGIICEMAEIYNLRILYAGPYSDFAFVGDRPGQALGHCYPLGGIFKSEVYEIAKRIGLPKKFLRKKPGNSAIDDQQEFLKHGLKFSDIEKLAMFFNGLLPEEKIEHIPKEKRIYFRYLLELFKKDIDYPMTDRNAPLLFGRQEFFQRFESFPFEKKKKDNSI